MQKFLIGASLLALAAGPAFAQDAPGADEDVVVTATRSAARVETLPADVTVLNAEDAIARGDVTLDAALSDVAGLDVVRTGPLGQQASVFAGGANSQHTLFLFDGVRINDPSTPGAGFDAGQDLLGSLARIEIVQGPMSALYGSDAIGGVVNLVPRRGGDRAIEARIGLAGGSFGALSGDAGINGTIGALRYGVTLEGYESDGYDVIPERMSTHTGAADGASMIAATGVFELDLSADVSVDLLVRARRAEADFDAFVFDLSTFQEIRTDDPDLRIARNDSDLARLGATWRVSEEVSLRASGGLVRTDRAQADGGVETDVFEGERRFADVTGAYEGAGFSLSFGATAETEEIDAVQFGSPIAAEQDHTGAYVAGVFAIGVIDFTGALRLDDYEGFGAETTWRIGANWRLSESARIWAAYGTSFRAPTLYERFAPFGDPDLNPEEGESFEIGAEAVLSVFGQSDGLELRALYRQSDLTNMIDFGPAFTYANVDEAELESAEARVIVRPLEWLSARVSYVYTDARDGVTGAQLLRRPESAWSARIDADWGDFDARLSWRSVGARSDILYDDDGVFVGTGIAPSYEVVRLSGGWRVSEGVRLSAAIDNVFDEAYEPANAFAGAARNVWVGVRWTQ